MTLVGMKAGTRPGVGSWASPRSPARRGFALVEVGAVVVILLLLTAIALPLARAARGSAWNAGNLENLHRFASATTSYAADNADLYWGFSWKKGMEIEGPDGGILETDLEACAFQAVRILRTTGGREDIGPISQWFPHPMYSHLALYDYLSVQFPAHWGVAPADRWRLAWASEPAAFDKGEFLPKQPSPSNANKRWPYSSSYELAPAFYDKSEPAHRIYQQSGHIYFSISDNADLGALRTGDVEYPSQKAHLFERDDWSFSAAGRFYAVPEARIAVLFTDGSAGIRTSGDANPGWRPNNPDGPDPTYMTYSPQAWEPPTSNGSPQETVIGSLRWTRNGIAGRDFGGPEVGPP